MTPSIFQQKIYDTVPALKPGQNLIISALAGSGKTTTIVECLKLLPFDANILFLAFNKSIATELQSRVPVNVEASTLNSFGWRVCLKNLPSKPKLSTYKTDDILKEFIFDKKAYNKARGPIAQLVGLMKAWMFTETFTQKDLEDLIQKYAIEIPDPAVFGSVIRGVYTRVIAAKHVMDFDDQLFFPIHYNMELPKYDYIFVDEAQDLNPVQIQLIQRLGGIVVAVGDPNQAIYGFRGADPNAMDRLQNRLNAQMLPLSICYRCSKNVIKLAQRLVPAIESHESAPIGEVIRVSQEEMQKDWKDGDFVLCRVTAPLVINCLKMIRAGRRANVKGRDIGKNLIDMLEKLPKADTLAESLQLYENNEIEKFQRVPNSEARIALLQDKCETLMALIESTERGTLVEVKLKVSDIFADDDAQGIIFSTIHKSKGLEAERVFILETRLLPHPAAKLPWQKAQEKNLEYVAYTRAKLTLVLDGGVERKEKTELDSYEDVEVTVEEYKHGV